MEIDETGGDVNDQQALENVTPVEDTTPDTAQEETEVQAQTEDQPSSDLDDRGVPWKNRAMELERKLSNLSNDIPTLVEQIVEERQSKPQEQKYTIEQLEAFAMQDESQRPWVEAQKAKLIQENILHATEEKFTKQKEQEKFAQQQAEATKTVLTDQRYAEAFVDDGRGGKTWNPNSQLALQMQGYMRDPRIKNQPDAIAVAAKLARADLVDQGLIEAKNKLTTLQRKNASLQKQTLVEGGGVPTQTQTIDAFQEASSRLSETGSMKDAQSAIRAYFDKKYKK